VCSSTVGPISGALPRLPSSGARAPGRSRQVTWAEASLKGEDPTRWVFRGGALVTSGGTRYNQLLVAVLRAAGHPKGLSATALALHGLTSTGITPAHLAELAREVHDRRLIRMKTVNRFVETTRFLAHLSPALAGEEGAACTAVPRSAQLARRMFADTVVVMPLFLGFGVATVWASRRSREDDCQEAATGAQVRQCSAAMIQ
jgi:hypothetical protein